MTGMPRVSAALRISTPRFMRAVSVVACVRAALALLALTAIAAPVAAEVVLRIDPDPPRAGEPFTVRVEGLPEAATNATLRTCVAENRVVQYCHLPMPMTAEGPTAIGVTREGFPAGRQVGVAVTWRGPDGATAHYPSGEDYAFFEVAAAAPASAPFPAGAAVATALASAAVTLRRRER